MKAINNQTHRKSVRKRLINIHQSGVAFGVENVGKWTPSDPMAMGGHGRTPLDAVCLSSLNDELRPQKNSPQGMELDSGCGK